MILINIRKGINMFKCKCSEITVKDCLDCDHMFDCNKVNQSKAKIIMIMYDAVISLSYELDQGNYDKSLVEIDLLEYKINKIKKCIIKRGM